MSLKSLIEKLEQLNSESVSEAVKEIPGGRKHTADPGGYGRKDDEDSDGKKVEPQIKRGRGRPSTTGAHSQSPEEKEKQAKREKAGKDLQSFMVGNLPGGKAPGKKGQVHKIKDESIEESTDVTDYTPKSKGGTRAELIAKYKKTKDSKDAEAARKAGATQKELQAVTEMDKSQPSSDRGGESSGDPYAKGGKATSVKSKAAAKDAEKILNKSMKQSHKKGVAEGSTPNLSVLANRVKSELVSGDLDKVITLATEIADDERFPFRSFADSVKNAQLTKDDNNYRHWIKTALNMLNVFIQRVQKDMYSNMQQGVAEGEGVYRHKGTYGTSYDSDDTEKAAPAVKRGRGRPRKDADVTGHVPKWDTDTLSKWIVGSKPKTLPGKPGVKHKLKDWIEQVETRMIVESIVDESRMSEVDIVFHDLVNGNLDIYDVMNHPRDSEQQYASKILHQKYERIAGEEGLHPDDDFEQIQARILDELEREHHRDLDEVALDPSQVAAPQIKAPGTTSATSSTVQAQGAPSTSGQAQLGAAIIDFKNPQDPLKSALQQAVKNKQVTVMATESKKITESAMAEKLDGILRSYPHEHKLAQEGWGMHESLYQALCDYYWHEGRIPRETMHGDRQALRDFVEECYAQDTVQLDENPLVGLAVRGLAAGAGAELAKHALDDDVDPSKIPAFRRKALGQAPLTTAEVGTTDMWRVGNKTFTAQQTDFARKFAEVSGLPLEKLGEAEMQAELDSNIEEMETTMKENKEVAESGLQAYLGKKKYGEEGMQALQKAGREGAGKKKMAQIRAKHDKLDEEDMDEGMWDKFTGSKFGQKTLDTVANALDTLAGNRGSGSKTGQTFGKGQVTPGGPMGPIARYQNRNKNESVAEAANPKIDISATEKYALKVVNDLMYDPVGREARFLTKTAGLPFTYYNEDELQKTGVAKFIIPYIDDDTPQGSHGIGSKYEALENIWTRYFRGKQAEGWLSSQPRQMPTGKTTSDGKKIWTFVFGFAIPNKGHQFEQQGVAEFGAYYEKLAQKVFDKNPSLDNEEEILNLGYNIAKDELGSRARGIFRDEDFPSDFVSAYNYLKKQGVAEDSESQFVAARYIDEFADGEHWYVKGTPEVIQKFVQLANSLEDEAVKGTHYEPGKGMMAKMHADLGDDSIPHWKIVKAQNLEGLKPLDNKVLQLLMRPDLSDGAQEFMSDFLWSLEEKGLAMVSDNGLDSVSEVQINEKLTKSMSAGDVISDFVGSDDPKFKGKSKAERTKMALGAYYGMHPEKSRKKTEESDMQMESWHQQLSSLLNEGMTVTTSTGNEGAADSVSVSATDSDAQELMQILQHSGLLHSKNTAMSAQAPEQTTVAVEPVSSDEVMSTLEPQDDDNGDDALGFLKKMIGARAEHSAQTSDENDHGQEDYADEQDAECEDCGHSNCECDHEQVEEMHNQTANPGTGQMSPVPEEVDVDEGNLFTGRLAAARAAGKKEADLDGDGDMEKVREEALDQPATMESDVWAGAGEQDMAAALAQNATSREAAETEKETAMSESDETCNECGSVMEQGHKCNEELNEWANSPNGKSTDEAFLADMSFMTKLISGGLNNMKQDQTTVPSARVKTNTEVRSTENSMAEMLRKLQNIN